MVRTTIRIQEKQHNAAWLQPKRKLRHILLGSNGVPETFFSFGSYGLLGNRRGAEFAEKT